jgi:uncharacterized membrane protein YeaQ/YmgE (transglycosylase-associated protein family)
MNVIPFLLFGVVVGVVARMIVLGRQPGGWMVSIVIGIVGAFVGGFLGSLLGLHGQGQAAGFLMSVVGAVALLVGYHALSRRRAPI